MELNYFGANAQFFQFRFRGCCQCPQCPNLEKRCICPKVIQLHLIRTLSSFLIKHRNLNWKHFTYAWFVDLFRIISILTKLYPIYRKLNHLEELELGFNYITELNPSGMSNLKNMKHFSILGCRGSPLKIQSNTFRFFQYPNFLVYVLSWTGMAEF